MSAPRSVTCGFRNLVGIVYNHVLARLHVSMGVRSGVILVIYLYYVYYCGNR